MTSDYRRTPFSKENHTEGADAGALGDLMRPACPASAGNPVNGHGVSNVQRVRGVNRRVSRTSCHEEGKRYGNRKRRGQTR